jgi:hypothetical protein
VVLARRREVASTAETARFLAMGTSLGAAPAFPWPEPGLAVEAVMCSARSAGESRSLVVTAAALL